MFRPLVQLMGISIHAPRKGATTPEAAIPTSGCIFQSTPPARGRRDDPPGRLRDIVFQSTPPARGRLLVVGSRRGVPHFNPRPPQGGDAGIFVCSGTASDISIHAPRKGATTPISRRCWFVLFQSTPPARGRRRTTKGVDKCRHFNPRPPQGGDGLFVYDTNRHRKFQSTPPARGRQVFYQYQRSEKRFQSTPPARGRQQRCTVLPADL